MQTLKELARTVNTLVQVGDFEQAMAVVDQAIERQPEVGELRRIGGSIATSLGHLEVAQARLREAAALGADPAYLLGDEACLSAARGDLVRAQEQAATAAGMRSGSASLHVIRGKLAAQAGAESVEKRSYKRALQIEPTSPTAALGLARAFRKAGSTTRPFDVLKRVLMKAPAAPGVFWQLLLWCAEDGKLTKAEKLASTLTTRNPSVSRVWLYRGLVQLRLDKFDDAIDAFREALRLEPSDHRSRLALGAALVQERRMHEAVGVFSEGFNEDDPDLETGLGLAQAYEGLGKQHSAHALFARLAVKYGGDARVALGLARHVGAGGDFDAALAKYDALLQVPEQRVHAAVGKAELLGKQGRVADAVAILDGILSEEPTNVAALSSRLHFASRGHAVGEDVMASAEFIARTSAVKQPTLSFALGTLRHKEPSPAEAFEWWRAANLASGVQYNAPMTEAYFSRVQAQYAERPANVSESSAGGAAVFLVGMPRSGTSLTEQALAMHPQVAGGGELSILPSIVRLIPSILQSGVQYPEYTASLTSENLAELGDEYLDNVAEILGERRYVTDKLPHNFLHVGFLSQILPNATVLHCRRNPMDNCLSLFQTYFAGQHAYAYSLDTIAQYYRLYDTLMKHWRRIGLDVVGVPYERTVADLEGTMRMLCGRLDLEWAPEILSFHKSSRVVMTASNAQVTKPLYSSSIGRWKVYEKQLAPLRDALDDICQAYAAEVPEAEAAI